MIIHIKEKMKLPHQKYITKKKEYVITLPNYLMRFYILWDINVYMFLDTLLKKTIALIMTMVMPGL